MNKLELNSLIENKIKKVLKEFKLNEGLSEKKIAELIDNLKKKKYSAVEATNIFCGNHKNYNNIVSSDLVDENNIEFGAGGFEETLQKLGYKYTDSDVNKLDEAQIAGLLVNVFYNVDNGLTKLIPDNIVEKLVLRFIELDGSGDILQINVNNRTALAKKMQKIFLANGIDDGLFI